MIVKALETLSKKKALETETEKYQPYVQVQHNRTLVLENMWFVPFVKRKWVGAVHKWIKRKAINIGELSTV